MENGGGRERVELPWVDMVCMIAMLWVGVAKFWSALSELRWLNIVWENFDFVVYS